MALCSDKSHRLNWRPARFKKLHREVSRLTVRPLRNAKKLCSTCASTNSDNLEVPTLPSRWHFSQMSNRSPGTSNTDLQGSSWRMSKHHRESADKVQRPPASHGVARGGEVRHPGLRQLGHAVLTECTWNLRLCSVS